MGRLKKGRKKKSQDLWQLAGGRDALVKKFIQHKLSDSATAEKWVAVTVDVFKSSNPKFVKWIKVIWADNRKGLKMEVLEGRSRLKDNYFLHRDRAEMEQ